MALAWRRPGYDALADSKKVEGHEYYIFLLNSPVKEGFSNWEARLRCKCCKNMSILIGRDEFLEPLMQKCDRYEREEA